MSRLNLTQEATPAMCEAEAQHYEKQGDFSTAALWWAKGSRACLGHGRAERYEQAAARCRRAAIRRRLGC